MAFTGQSRRAGKSKTPESLTFDRKSISGKTNFDTWDPKAGPAASADMLRPPSLVPRYFFLRRLPPPTKTSPLFINIRLNS